MRRAASRQRVVALLTGLQGIKAPMPGGYPKVLLGIGGDQDSDKGDIQ